jgi:hypothetical protein
MWLGMRRSGGNRVIGEFCLHPKGEERKGKGRVLIKRKHRPKEFVQRISYQDEDDSDEEESNAGKMPPSSDSEDE